MSGIEIAVAAAAATSLVASGVSAYSQVQLANESAKVQADQIREQQLQLRLQQNQSQLERTRKLRETLATEEVMFGTRGIAPGSGTILGIVSQNMNDYYSDTNYESLNFGAKKGALAAQANMVEMQRKSQVFNAYTGFVKEGANTIISAAGAYGMPTGKAPSGATSGLQSGGTYGSNAYFNNQFNLNR